MKKFFTLIAMGTFVLVGKKSKAQINENFENGLATLTANCWQFSSMMYATSPSSYVINGNASCYSEPPVSADSIRIMRTPLLIIDSSIDVSFTYRLSNNLTGQAIRRITVDLTDNNGVVVQNLTSFNVPNNATSATSFNQTFMVNTPGIYRLAVSLSGGQGAGSVRLSVDDLYESEAVYGCSQSPLPVKLVNFHGNKNEDKVSLQWTIAQNETADRFEVQRSYNGRDFVTAAIVMTNSNGGDQTYAFKETINNDAVYYRLRMIDKDQSAGFSKTLAFRSKSNNETCIRIISNPVTDKLTFSFTSPLSQVVTLKIYDISGRTNMLQKLNVFQGTNSLSLPLTSSVKRGMHVVEVTDGATSLTAKFLRQ